MKHPWRPSCMALPSSFSPSLVSLPLLACLTANAGCRATGASNLHESAATKSSGGGAASFEDIPENEGADIDGLITFIQDAMSKQKAGGQAVTRFTHAKTIGCVAARFAVSPDLAPKDRVGLFAQPSVYNAWIRYSSFNGVIQPDTVPDNRGMAIKLLDVPGDRLQKDGDSQTLDFVLTTGTHFSFETPKLFLQFSQAQRDGTGAAFFAPRPRTLQLNLDLVQTGNFGSFSDGTYGTHIPHLFGNDRAVKFVAKPCVEQHTPVKRSDFDALGEQLKDEIANEAGGCFNLYVTFFTDKQTSPIEDATIEWPNPNSLKVATITIPKQDPNIVDDKKAFCEKLAFSPWRTLPEHQPLGSIARLRRKLYPVASRVRNQLNNTKSAEPTSADFPLK